MSELVPQMSPHPHEATTQQLSSSSSNSKAANAISKCNHKQPPTQQLALQLLDQVQLRHGVASHRGLTLRVRAQHMGLNSAQL